MSEDQTPTSPAAELVAVVEDLVERQRQILGAFVATTHPLKNDVQAVLLGMRGVVTKLRNGAAEADATTPTNPDLRSQVAERLSAVGITHTPSTTLDPLYDRLAERVVQDVINPLMERLQRERDAYRAEYIQMKHNWDAAREANTRLLSRPSVSDQTPQPISLPRAHQIAQEIAEEAEARRSALAEREAASDQTPARPKGAVRGRGNDPVTITNNQLTNWAARIARLAWSAEDDTAHGKAIALAMEMKALTAAAPSSVQGDTTPGEGDQS